MQLADYSTPNGRAGKFSKYFALEEVRDYFYHYMLDFMTIEFRSEPLANGGLGSYPLNYEALTTWNLKSH